MPSLYRLWTDNFAADADALATTTSTPTTTEEPGTIHHANFEWYEEWDDVSSDMGPMFPGGNNAPPYHRYVELSPLLPFGMMLVISTIIFMLIIFRRWPGLVAGIVAGFLTSLAIYLMLLSLNEQRLVYE